MSRRLDLPEPSRSEALPPLSDQLPGPIGTPDAGRADADALLTEAGSTAAAGYMGSTYVSEVGGPLYRDLQEAAVEVGSALAHADAEEVLADATWAWTRSDLLGEVVRRAIVEADIPNLPSDRAVRRLARTVAVLLLRGATPGAVGQAVAEAIAAVSLSSSSEVPQVVVREVGVTLHELGPRAAQLLPGAIEVEVPFPPGADFGVEDATVRAVLSATKPAAISADVRYVATETARMNADADGLSDECMELNLDDDARWYFSGRAPRWGEGIVLLGGQLVADPERDFEFVPEGAALFAWVPGWPREVRRRVVRPACPLEVLGARPVSYTTIPSGLRGQGTVVRRRWFYDPAQDFSRAVPGERIQVANGEWRLDSLGGARGGPIGHGLGRCTSVSVARSAVEVDVPLPPGAMVRYLVEADRRGRSKVRPVHVSMTTF